MQRLFYTQSAMPLTLRLVLYIKSIFKTTQTVVENLVATAYFA